MNEEKDPSVDLISKVGGNVKFRPVYWFKIGHNILAFTTYGKRPGIFREHGLGK